MFLLTGYEYFLGFLLIAAAVPILALLLISSLPLKAELGKES